MMHNPCRTIADNLSLFALTNNAWMKPLAHSASSVSIDVWPSARGVAIIYEGNCPLHCQPDGREAGGEHGRSTQAFRNRYEKQFLLPGIGDDHHLVILLLRNDDGGLSVFSNA